MNDLPVLVAGDPPSFAGEILVRLNIRLKNVGRILARNACIRIVAPLGVRWGDYDNSMVHPRGKEPYWELEGPVYPGMEIGFWIGTVMAAEVAPPRSDAIWGGPWLIGSKTLSDARFQWQLFADNAPTKEGRLTLEELGFREAAGRALDKDPQGAKIRNVYDFL